MPTLEVGKYYSQPNGVGNEIPSGTEISTTQTIYVYAETATQPNCTEESSFTVTISEAVYESLFANSCKQFTIGNQTFTESGVYEVHLETVNGCDSIINLTLTIVEDPLVCGFDPCEPIIDLTEALFAGDPHQALYHAGMKLLSNGIVTSGNAEELTFKAGDEVDLNPGFEVQLGALLTVVIEDCVLEEAGVQESKNGTESEKLKAKR